MYIMILQEKLFCKKILALYRHAHLPTYRNRFGQREKSLGNVQIRLFPFFLQNPFLFSDSPSLAVNSLDHESS